MEYSMTFDGVRKPFVKVLEKGRPYWAPRAVETMRSGNVHRVIRIEAEPMVIPVTILVDGNSKTDLLNKAEDIALWLNTTEVTPLIFDDQPNRIYWSVLDGSVDVDEIVSFSTTEIEFISVDKTGLDKELLAEGNHIIYGHKSTAWKTKTIFTETVTSYEFKFYRAGHDTSLRNINAIKINYQFTVGDTLVIDFSRRAVLLNDNDITNSLVILQSNFMELPIGEVIFEATEETEVFYNERYY